MKPILTLSGLAVIACTLAACGSDEKTTVIHDRPVIVQPAVQGSTPGTVENNCAHGYSNETHSCY